MRTLNLAYWLLIVHLLLDYPLQGNFLSKAKNHRSPIAGVPWYTALFSHAAIQGAGVGFVTGSALLAVAETVAHALIDFGKSDGRYGFNVDQALHIACKVAWVTAIIVAATLPTS